jgi:hypothetical protein
MVLTGSVSTMKRKNLTGRDLRRGAPEESLSPGESLIIKKAHGKVFKLTRVDHGARDMNAAMERLFAQVPLEGKTVRTDLARIIIEERE